MTWIDWLIILGMIGFVCVSIFCYVYTIVSLFRKKD